MESKSWQDIFVPRLDELSQLRAAWEKAKSGETVVAAIVAESGFGKTRIAQEFFSWLSIHEDAKEPNGYWPDRLGNDRDNLRVNPILLPESHYRTEPMPFLWWGLRLNDPGQRNQQFGTALRSGTDILAVHLHRYQQSERRRRIQYELSAEQRRLAVDLGTDVVGNIVSFGLLSAFKRVADHQQKVAKIEGQLEDLETAGSAEDQSDITDTLVSDLGCICHAPPAGMKVLPVVILIDDAHWMANDPTVRRFLDRLVRQGVAERWPMLILLTSWEREWRGKNGVGLASYFTSLGAEPAGIQVGKLDLTPILRQALPGLTRSQHEAVKLKADGNPSFVSALIGLLHGRPSLFVDRDASRPLTTEGEIFLEQKSHDDLTFLRFHDSPLDVQQILSIASLQGVSFSPGLAVSTCSLLGAQADGGSLARAEDPFSFVKLNKTAGEFRQRAIWSVAREHLPDLFDPEAAQHAFQDAMLNYAGEPDQEADEIIAQEIDSESHDRRMAAMVALSRIMGRALDRYEYLVAEGAANQWLDSAQRQFPSYASAVSFSRFSEVFIHTERNREWNDYLIRWLRTFVDNRLGGSLSELGRAPDESLYGALSLALSVELRAPIDDQARQEAGEIAVACAEELLRRSPPGERGHIDAARDLRIALQRRSDAMRHGEEREKLVRQQMELAQQTFEHMPPEQATSDLYNTMIRLATTHLDRGERPQAVKIQLEGCSLWRALAKDQPSHSVLKRLAEALMGAILVRGNKKPDKQDRELAREGLDAAVRAFHLASQDVGVTGKIEFFAKVLGKEARKDSGFQTFLRRGQVLLAFYMDRQASSGLSTLERRQAISLAIFLGNVHGSSRDRSREYECRESTIRLVEAQPDYTRESTASFIVAQAHLRQATIALTRLELAKAVRLWRIAQRHLFRLTDILESQGVEFGPMDIARGRVPYVRLETPPSDEPSSAAGG